MADHSADAREPLVGVSLKMFLGYAESLRYLAGVASAAPGFSGVGVFVLPSFPVLAEAATTLRGTTVAYGAQDGHWEQEGAYTGCVSPSLLRELGCTFMEVGHAERRRLFGEDDAMAARKAGAAVDAGLVPVICIGEEEAGGDAAARAVAQAGAVLAELRPDATAVIAYEPIWAIGAEAPADERHIALVASALRASTSSRPGRVRLLYGGSVAAGRVGEIMRAGLDGVFVGRGALALEGLCSIVDEVRAAA
jgi:triosephosphate isomerase